jgi:hypothetical protein
MCAKAGFLKSFSEKSHINDRLVRVTVKRKKGKLGGKKGNREIIQSKRLEMF